MAKKSVISCCKVNKNQIAELAHQLKLIDCPNEFSFLFAGHKPISAVLVLNGSVNVYSGKKCLYTYSGSNLLLYEEFLNAKPVKYTIKIANDSQFCWVDKSLIEKLLQDETVIMESAV